MTLRLTRSNRTERLVETLTRALSGPTDHPFRPDVVVVHSRGLGTWLQQQLAHEQGVCANVKFLQPGALLDLVLGELVDDEPGAWEADALVWTLHHVLDASLDDPAFATVARWAREDGPAHVSRRLVGLAQQLAPRFERYALYRPDLVATWTEDGDWQERLWVRAAARLQGANLAQRLDRAEAELARVDWALALPGRVAAFSVVTLAPRFVSFLGQISRRVPVDVLLLTPSPHTVTDLSPGQPLPTPADIPSPGLHPLRRSMGHLERDLVAHLQVQGALVVDAFDTPEPSTLLGGLQHDLLEDALPTTPRPLAEARPSVRLHACPGELRQVEALRDVLIECFEEDPTLQPREVLVMASDVERFGPMLKAVLADGTPYRPWKSLATLPALPHRLADRGLSTRNPIAQVMLRALDLFEGRFEVTEVLDLLAMAPVLRHRQLGPEQLPDLRQLVAAAHIHWGVDTRHRDAENVPSSDIFTWRGGLDALLLGQAVADPSAVFDGLAPAGALEDKEARRLLGALCGFVAALVRHREALDGEHLPQEWGRRLGALLDDLVGRAGWQGDAVRSQVAEVVQAAHAQPVPRDVMVRVLAGRFDLPEPGLGYLAGGVTLCAMVPMRSIPFKIVCLLGMDDGAFPRTGVEPVFDRIQAEPRLGDRTPREDDRALFLETLLSARERLEVFYSSSSPTDGKPRPPSVVVAELLDVLDESFTTNQADSRGRPVPVRQAITVEHSLQPFALDRYACQPGETPVWGFDPRAYRAVRAWVEGEPRGERLFLGEAFGAPDFQELDPRELAQLFRAPMRQFCTKVLEVQFDSWGSDPTDREPLELPGDGLVKWQYRNAALTAMLEEGVAPSDLEATWRAQGRLPLGSLGTVILRDTMGEVYDTYHWVTSARSSHARAVLIDRDLGLFRLVGRLQVHGDVLVRWQAGGINAGHQLGLWIEHLALNAAEPHRTSRLCAHDEVLEYRGMESAAALEHLEELAAIFVDGYRVPLLLLPEISLVWQRALRDGKDAAGAARRVWNNPWARAPDDYERWVLGDQRPFDGPVTTIPVPEGRTFAELAQTVLDPMIQAEVRR